MTNIPPGSFRFSVEALPVEAPPVEQPSITMEQKRADARRAKGWKHTADFLNQIANTTVSLGFLAPLATWAFGVQNNPLSADAKAPIVAVVWMIVGVFLHICAGTIVRSFDL